jgi:hypothetical protein
MGKMFQNASSLKPLGTIETKLPMNDHCGGHLGFPIGIKNPML